MLIFSGNLSNHVYFLTAKLMNSWKHSDMKQTINITQNSLQIWDIAIHLEESRVAQNVYFYQEETQYCTVHIYSTGSN